MCDQPALPDSRAPRPADPRSAAARRRAGWGLAGALVATVLLTVAVAGDWAAVTRFDDALTSFTRDWADPLGWPVDVALLAFSAWYPSRYWRRAWREAHRQAG